MSRSAERVRPPASASDANSRFARMPGTVTRSSGVTGESGAADTPVATGPSRPITVVAGTDTVPD